MGEGTQLQGYLYTYGEQRPQSHLDMTMGPETSQSDFLGMVQK